MQLNRVSLVQNVAFSIVLIIHIFTNLDIHHLSIIHILSMELRSKISIHLGNIWISTIGSGDFSHSPQHVFWTCLDQIVKSKDMSSQKNTGFLDGLK